jgi:6-phosphogluconate dehydrogenase (decarboxylating)
MAAIRTTAMTCSRAAEWKAGGIHYLDVSTSGGVAGLDRGCCLIIGGEADTVAHLRPVFFRPRLFKVGNAGQKS